MMLKETLVLAVSSLAFASAAASAGDTDRVPERVDTTQGSPFPLPGPISDEAGRIIARPPPPEIRNARDVLLRLPVLPEAVGDAGSEPRRAAPPPRGEP
jgi:hypothetical protein